MEQRTSTLKVGEIRFSQATIGDPTRLHGSIVTVRQLAETFRVDGYVSEPIHVVRMSDGKATSLDNRRLWAALQAGLTEIPCVIHEPDERFAATATQVRSLALQKSPLVDREGTFGQRGSILYPSGYEPKTYLDAVVLRCGRQRKTRSGLPFSLTGTLEPPRYTTEEAAVSTDSSISSHKAITDKGSTVDRLSKRPGRRSPGSGRSGSGGFER